MGEGAVLKRRTVKQQSGASKSTLVFMKIRQRFCENQSAILVKSECDFVKKKKKACDFVKISQ